MIHTLRIRTSSWKKAPSFDELKDIAGQINAKSSSRGMFGQIAPNSAKLSLSATTHVVLPTAKVNGSTIIVEIEMLDNEMGRTLKEMIRTGLSVQGVLRGRVDTTGRIVVFSVDVDTKPDDELTVLDDIVDALEDAESA